VTGTLAELTGRSDDELRLALTVAAVVAALFGALRLINYLAGLGVFRPQPADMKSEPTPSPRRRPRTA
jgi:hypothetical protein